MFVQNCFVDTHDLRFPWVAFFALEYIRYDYYPHSIAITVNKI